jgi:outer membrane protein TolC
MTDLEQAKVTFADAALRLEIAQGKYKEAKQNLLELLQWKNAETTPKSE